jgi:hypothetical protein
MPPKYQLEKYADMARGARGRSNAGRALKIMVLTLGGLAILAAAALAALNWYAVWKTKAAVRQLADRLAPLAEIQYQEVKVGFFDRRVQLAGLTLKPAGGGEKIKIERIELENFDMRHPIPHRLSLKVQGIEIPAPEALGAYGAMLKKFGFQRLAAEAVLAYNYDASSHLLTLQAMWVKVRDAGEISLAGTLAGVRDSDLVSLTLNPPDVDWQAWAIVQGRVVYRDDSFSKRFLLYQAKRIGETLLQLRYGMSVDVEQAIKDEQDDFTRASLQQFQVFIASLTYLEITARPERPVTYADLQKAYDRDGLKGLIPVLKLTFSAHQPG